MNSLTRKVYAFEVATADGTLVNGHHTFEKDFRPIKLTEKIGLLKERILKGVELKRYGEGLVKSHICTHKGTIKRQSNFKVEDIIFSNKTNGKFQNSLISKNFIFEVLKTQSKNFQLENNKQIDILSWIKTETLKNNKKLEEKVKDKSAIFMYNYIRTLDKIGIDSKIEIGKWIEKNISERLSSNEIKIMFNNLSDVAEKQE